MTVLVDWENDSVRTARRGGRSARSEAVGRAARHIRAAGRPLAVRRRWAASTRAASTRGWSRSVRTALDAAGFPDVRIVASGGFNAERIEQLRGARGSGRRLRRRLLADPRPERLHRRRGDRRRPAVREGRPAVPPEPAARATSTDAGSYAPASMLTAIDHVGHRRRGHRRGAAVLPRCAGAAAGAPGDGREQGVEAALLDVGDSHVELIAPLGAGDRRRPVPGAGAARAAPRRLPGRRHRARRWLRCRRQACG